MAEAEAAYKKEEAASAVGGPVLCSAGLGCAGLGCLGVTDGGRGSVQEGGVGGRGEELLAQLSCGVISPTTLSGRAWQR